MWIFPKISSQWPPPPAPGCEPCCNPLQQSATEKTFRHWNLEISCAILSQLKIAIGAEALRYDWKTLLDPATSIPVLFRTAYDADGNISNLAAFNLDGTDYLGDVTLLSDCCSGGGGGGGNVTVVGALPAGGNTIGNVGQGPGGSSAWKVTGAGGIFPISGSVTATLSGPVDQGTGGASAWLVTGAGGTFPVTGTFWQATQPVSAVSLPLPTNAAQETGGNLDFIVTSVANIPSNPSTDRTTSAAPFSVRLSDGAAFYNALTDAQLRATPVPISGTISLSNYALETGGNLDSIDTKIVTVDTSAVILAAGTAEIGNVKNSGTFAVQAAQFGSWTIANTTFGATQGTSPWVVSGTVTTTPPSNASTNITQWNGTTVLAGNGATGTGSPRVTIASDNTPFAIKIDQTTPGTTNAVVPTPIDQTSSGTITGSAQTVVLSTLAGVGTVGIQVTGSWTATLQFEGSVDGGTTYVSVNGHIPSTGGATVSTAANGAWLVGAAGFSHIRVRSSAFTSGTATVFLRGSQGSSVVGLDNGLTSSSATIGVVNAQGTIAAGATDSGAPVKIGGLANSSAPADVTTGQRVNAYFDLKGRLKVDASDFALAAGTNIIGKVGIDQTTPGTTNLVALSAETTKVIGVVRNADGSGNLLTSTSNALDVNLKTSSITLPISGSVTANAGANLNTSLLALDASVSGILLTQASTTSGQTGPLIQGAVTTAAPSYTTAKTNPLSLQTDGSLRTAITNTPAVTVNSGTVTFSNSTIAVTQATAASLNATVVGTGTFATQATQSGTWTVQPGNTANTTAWKVDGSAVTQPISAASLPLPALASTSTKQSDGSQKTQIVDGSGNVIASTSNALNVAITSGGSSGTQYADGAVRGTATGTLCMVDDGTNIQSMKGDSSGRPDVTVNSGTITANIGTAGTLALDASVTGLQVSQGSTTSGQKGGLVLGAVTTAAPSYTTAQSSPISLQTDGSLRTAITNTPAVTVSSGTVTFSNSTIAVTQATAASLNATVVGTGTFVVQATLAAETTKVIGVTRTADGSGNLLTSTGAALDVNLKTSSITLPVSGTVTTTPPSNASTNITQWNGVTVSTGTGVMGTGVVRVAIASDNDALAVKQATAANLNATVVGTGTFATQSAQSGGWTVTANAGTSLNTSLLALESGGNLASIKAKTDNIPAQGQALAATSLPVVLPADQITELTDAMGGGTSDDTVVALNDLNTVVGELRNFFYSKFGGNAPLNTQLENSLSVTTNGYQSSLLVKVGAGKLFSISGFNSKATAQWIQIFNDIKLPPDGTVPTLPSIYVDALKNFSWDSTQMPEAFSRGLVICNSTAGPTKTIGSADVFFNVRYI